MDLDVNHTLQASLLASVDEVRRAIVVKTTKPFLFAPPGIFVGAHVKYWVYKLLYIGGLPLEGAGLGIGGVWPCSPPACPALSRRIK